MTAIETRFIGPTNHRGSRYKAIALDTKQTITVTADDTLSCADNHAAVAKALIKRQGWNYAQWVVGASDRGYIFVCEKGERI